MKIRFPRERDHGDRRQPIWVPVNQAWAGEGYGLFSLPRTDHEVLVAFVEGEPDQRVIVGRVHNALRIRPRAGGAAARPGGGALLERAAGETLGTLPFDPRAGIDLRPQLPPVPDQALGRDHYRQGPPRCGLTARICGISRAFGGPDGHRVLSRTWRICSFSSTARPFAPPILDPRCPHGTFMGFTGLDTVKAALVIRVNPRGDPGDVFVFKHEYSCGWCAC